MARPPRLHNPRPTTPRPQREDLVKIAGLPAVQALFAADPARVERLFFDDRCKAASGDFCKEMAARRRPYRFVSTDELTKVAGTPLHGGILAVSRPKLVQTYDAEMVKRWAQDGLPLVILDGVGNPHNLGAIARTMAFFGLSKLLVSDHPAQALPSEAAWRVAEGGLEWVDVIQVPRLAVELKRLRDHYRVIGTALGAHRPLSEVMARGERGRPLAIVLGNEEAGLPLVTQGACEDIATLPGSGRVQSLNVAATAAILVHMLAT